MRFTEFYYRKEGSITGRREASLKAIWPKRSLSSADRRASIHPWGYISWFCNDRNDQDHSKFDKFELALLPSYLERYAVISSLYAITPTLFACTTSRKLICCETAWFLVLPLVHWTPMWCPQIRDNIKDTKSMGTWVCYETKKNGKS